MALTFCGLELEVDAEQTDTGDLLVVAPHDATGRLLLGRRALNGQGFAEAVRWLKEAAVRSLTDAKLIERTALKLAGREARMYHHAGWSADGIDTRHLLAIIHAGEELVTLSAAGVGRDYVRVRESFEWVLRRVREAGKGDDAN